MSKQSLLLVDGDTRSLRVLEVSLRKAGFSVTPAVSVGDALDKLEINPPDLIISETKFATDIDGFELRRRLRGTPEWAEIPFIFLTAETAIENKIKGLELGVDDYLTKPIYIKEIVTRINILLQKKQRQFLDLRKDGTRFAGRVADMPVVDVIQTIEVSRKSGVIQFTGGPNRQAAIYFRDGKVIDAEAGTLQGEDAVYRLLTWNEGEFEVEFRTVRRREVIETSSQGLLMEGMRRLDEWSRLLEQLPPLAHRFEIDAAELSTRLGEVPDDNNRILRLFDGKRTLLEVIDASDFGDLECLQAISRLYFEGLLIDLDPAVRNTGRTMTAQHVEEAGSGPHAVAAQAHAHAQTPIQAAASGPIDLANLEARASQEPETTLRDMPAQTSTTLTGMAVVSPSTTLRDMAAQSPPVTTPETTLRGLHVPVLREPAEPSGPHPMPTPPPMDSTAPVQPNDVIASEPLMAPNELAADMPRRRRDSAQAIDEGDVVAEEEVVLGPLAGGYRQSSLRLIDEAVAAAQLIEPSLFADDELAALGIKRATPEEIAAAQTRSAPPPPPATEPRGFPNNSSEERQAEVARLKQELRDSDPLLDDAKPAATSNGTNGRPSAPRAKTVPPPIPFKAKEIENAPMLDSELLTSGEIRIPTEEELAELSEADLLTSGEIKLPSETLLGAAGAPPKPPPGAKQPATLVSDEAPKGVTQGWDVPELPADVKADAPKGVTQGWDVPDVPVDLKALAEVEAKAADPSKAVTDRLEAPDAPKGVTQGWDVPEVPADLKADAPKDAVEAKTDAPKPEESKADPKSDVEAKVQATLIEDDDSGGVPNAIEADSKADQDILDNELPTDPSRKPRPFRPDDSQSINMIGSLGRDRAEASGELRPPDQRGETTPTQRELVTIMPRRKTGEVTQLRSEDVATLDAKGQQKAKAAVEAIEKAEKAEKDAKNDGFTKADAKPETKPDTKSEKPAAKSAVETPPRRVSVEGGVVVPQRGPGGLAQILIVVAALVGGVTVFSYCRKKSATKPVVSTSQDAGDRIVMAEPDAAEYSGFGVDAGTGPVDAAVVAVRPDAAKIAKVDAAVPPDAAVVAMRPDAAVVVPVATGDAGVATVDKNKEAAALATKGRTKLSEGEPQEALDLFDQSLKLKRDKRTFVDRGRALANLGKVDEAISSYDEAIKMSESYAPAWEQKGLTLWSAQRYGDARPALEMYLQLQPEGPKSETIRKMLDEPR